MPRHRSTVATTAWRPTRCLPARPVCPARTSCSARDGKLDAYALLAQQITESRGHLSSEQIAAARAAGLDDGKIIEVIAHVASQTLTNYLNNVALTDIDFPAIDA